MQTWKFWALSGLFAFPVAEAAAAPSLAISPLGYRLESVTPVAGVPRTYDVIGRAGVYNTGDPATNATAQLSNSSAQVLVVDGDLSFGNVGRVTRLRPVISVDTFKFRLKVPKPVSLAEALQFAQSTVESFSWRLSCGNCAGGNRPPVANAGANQTTYVNQQVSLDGSASMDPDGDALRFTWSLVSAPAGASAVISDAASVRPTTSLPVRGSYVFQLVVNDGSLDSAPSQVTITTGNTAPTAQAGPDKTSPVGARIALDGAGSSDVDGDPLTYDWQLIEIPQNSAAAIQNADPANPVADFVVDKPGRYVAQLTVRDPQSASVPDSTIVSTINSAPVANAGADRTAAIGEWVELSGAQSSDIDGDGLTYRWSMSGPQGSLAELASTTDATTAFSPDVPGVYVVQLLVNDGSVDSEADTVVVSTVNSRPVASAGGDIEAFTDEWVYLDGNGSWDADGDPLSYSWSLISRPPDSSAQLQEASSPSPYFVADVPGVFVAQLVVSDGNFDSEPSTTQVSVRVRDNEPPVITIESPRENSVVNSRLVRFVGQINEAGRLFIQYQLVPLDAQNRFDHPVFLNEGVNTVELYTQDSSANNRYVYWTLIVDTVAPAAPRLAALSRQVLADGQLLVRGGQQAVEARATVTVKNLRTGQSVTVMADDDGAFQAQLAGVEEDDLSIVAADAASNVSATAQMQGIGGGQLGVEVSAPTDGATVADRLVTIRGRVSGPADAGVSINGSAVVVFESDGLRQFAAQVALADGENLVEVAAQLPDGRRSVRQVRVIRTDAADISVRAVPAAGIAPFKTVFQVSQHVEGRITSTTIDLDGDGDVDVVSENDDHYLPGTYATPGIFDARVTVTLATGLVYQTTVPITVQDNAQANTQVQRTWTALRAAFEAGDPEAALKLFDAEAVEVYRPLLTAPALDLRPLASQLGQIVPAKFGGSFAEYIVTRNTGGVDEAFVVSFTRSSDGVWRVSAL